MPNPHLSITGKALAFTRHAITCHDTSIASCTIGSSIPPSLNATGKTATSKIADSSFLLSSAHLPVSTIVNIYPCPNPADLNKSEPWNSIIYSTHHVRRTPSSFFPFNTSRPHPLHARATIAARSAQREHLHAPMDNGLAIARVRGSSGPDAETLRDRRE
jgi:hypothetical protein